MALASVYRRGSDWFLGYACSTGIRNVQLPVKTEEEAKEFLAAIVAAVSRMKAGSSGPHRKAV